MVALAMPIPLLAIRDPSVQDTLFAVYVPSAVDLVTALPACGFGTGRKGDGATAAVVSTMAASLAVALAPEKTSAGSWGWLMLVVLLHPARRAVARLTGFPLFAGERDRPRAGARHEAAPCDAAG